MEVWGRVANAGKVGRDWGWLGGMLWGPRVEGLLRSALKPRGNSVERAGAVSGAERARSAVFRAQGLWRRCSVPNLHRSLELPS